MAERDQFRVLTFEERVNAMSPNEINAQLSSDNVVLAELGVRTPISFMVYGACLYGSSYEERFNARGGTRPTPMNCFMALLHGEPNLKQLQTNDFEKLAGTVSRISMATEALIEKTSEEEWLRAFTQSPQKSLSQQR